MRNIFPNVKEKDALLTQLNLLGAKRVRVEFQGGGDDGQIESVYYIDQNGDVKDIPRGMLSWTEQVWGDNTPQTQQITLQEALEDLCERALDETGLDWYNNDGGQGALVIDFEQSPPSIRLDVGINHRTTEDFEYDLLADEETE